jgi:anti-sigma-K factor RskA
MKQEFDERENDQMLAMAYVDGELERDERRRFESRLALEPALAKEVEDLRELALLSRRSIPPEPEDREWHRLGRDPLHRKGLRLGLWLCILAVAGFATTLGITVLGSNEHWTLQLFLLTGTAGVCLVTLLTLRERLAVLPHDPYRKVHR